MLAAFVFPYPWEELVVLNNTSPQGIMYALWYVDQDTSPGAGCRISG
jgi:hypothetical protein